MTSRTRTPKLLVASLLLSCGGGDGVTSPIGDDGPGDNGPLLIVQTSPAAGAAAVETGATLVARFNRTPDPATLTPGSFTIALGGVSLPSRLIHQSGSTDVTLVAPLLPGVELDYEAAVSTDVRDINGAALAQPHSWSFRTRALQRLVIESEGADGEQTSLALDRAGGVHASHVGGGNVTYSTCADACTDAANWQSSVIDRGGRSSSLKVDGAGRRHLAYYGASNELRYATCAEQCESPASWAIATIDPGITGDSRVSLALDGSGAVHVAYYDAAVPFLKYALCPADCGDAINWGVTLPDLPGAIGREVSLAIDPQGQLHLVASDQLNGLGYASCASDCLGDGWQSATIDATNGAAESSALAVGRDGRLHVAYQPGDTDDLRYASCGGVCLEPAAWTTTIVHPVPDAGEFAAIAVDEVDRLYLTYWVASAGTERLSLATCATGCTEAASWQSTTIDGGGPLGRYNAVAVDATGRLHVTYYDEARRDLKYLE
jgi:hypothetical protein